MKELLQAIFGEGIEIPKDPIECDALRMALYWALGTLSTRQQKVLMLRFGMLGKPPMTLKEVSKYCKSNSKIKPGRKVTWYQSWYKGTRTKRVLVYKEHITGARVRDIESKALRLLRHPCRSRHIKSCLRGGCLGKLLGPGMYDIATVSCSRSTDRFAPVAQVD
jgi:hypothetical protein